MSITCRTRSTDTGFAAALQGAADIAALAGAWVAGLCIAALTVLVLVDTIMAFLSRYIPALPSGTGIGWEYSAYLMGSAFVLGSGLTLRAGLEGFSMIATTLPVVLPLVEAAGFDKVWFGIFMVLVVEMAQITPPVAFNFVVIQNITGKSTGYIARVTFPFLAIMIAFVITLALFPGIVSFLPNLLLG